MTNVVEILILIANLFILGLNLKLYTEWFKARSIENRKKGGD